MDNSDTWDVSSVTSTDVNKEENLDKKEILEDDAKKGKFSKVFHNFIGRFDVENRVTPQSFDSPRHNGHSEEISMRDMSASTFSNPAYVTQTSIDDYCPPQHGSGRNNFPITIDSSENDVNHPFRKYQAVNPDTSPADDVITTSSVTRDSAFSSVLKGHALKLWRRTYRPNSVFMHYWLMVVSTAAFYNLWTIPLRATFLADIQVPWQVMWFVFDAISDLIYVVDIFIKFRTKYLHSGVYVNDYQLIVRQRLHDWTIFFDVVSIFPSDLFFISHINPYYRMNRVARLYRVCTFVRMVESNTTFPNIWRFINLMHGYVVILHYNACVYYGLSLVNGYGPHLTSWSYPDPKFFPEYAFVTRQYTYSFYWSIKSLTLLGGIPLPETNWQFAFTIFLQLMSIILAAVFIAYITSLVHGQHTKRIKLENERESTSQYLERMNLPQELRHKVDLFYQHMLNNAELGHSDKGKLLQHLPTSVKDEIAHNKCYMALKKIPELSGVSPCTLMRLVGRLKRMIFLPGQFVYKSGDHVQEVYVVGSGVLQNIRETDGHVSIIKDGGVFGDERFMSINRIEKRKSNVTSCGYTEVYMLKSSDAFDLLQADDSLRTHKLSAQSKKMTAKTQSIGGIEVSVESSRNVSTIQSDGRWTQVSSPDSGIPSSPGRKREEDLKLPRNIGLVIRPDVANKLHLIYQQNQEHLKYALDGFWNKEIAIFQNQLTETDKQRDKRASDVITARNDVITENDGEMDNPTPTSESSSTKEKTENLTSRTLTYSGKNRKRTVLPASAAISTKTSLSHRRPSAIQETPLDIYGSLTSLNSK